VDANGVVQIGMVIDELPDGPDISTGDNLISIDVVTNDYKARNKVIVWGPKDVGVIRSDEPWATVDHTMVIANPYISNASLLASKIHANVKDPEVIKTCEVLGDPDRKVGQHCDITSSIFTGEDYCTTLKSGWSKTDGYRMTQIFGERCAIFGKGAPVPEADGRDVIVATYGMGVWRCKDIWEGTPHWEPLNIGLEAPHPETGYDWPAYGGYKCDWFIRDPFEPNSRAFLSTKYGIYETMSLEPGSENWEVVYGAPVWKLRSIITHRGRYFAIRGPIGSQFGGWDKWIVISNDHCRHFDSLVKGGWGNCQKYAPFEEYAFDSTKLEASPLLGTRLSGEEGNIGLSSWHRLTKYCDAGKGGLAAWHRTGGGCTVAGTAAALSSCILTGAPGPSLWHGELNRFLSNHPDLPTVDYYYQRANLNPHIIPFDWWLCAHTKPSFRMIHNAAACWYKHPTIHIPYDQPAFIVPYVIYMSPGYWTGDDISDTGAYPAVLYTSQDPRVGSAYIALNPPWGGSNCHFLQGCISSYTPDRNKMYIFNAAKPSRFAISNNGGRSWTEKSSVPFKTSCFSGFPYSSNKIYTGRDPVRDPTPKDQDPPDTALIYVSWDRGDTWHDVTGDLWDQTKALGLRKDDYGNNLGARGLVTIAPRYL